MYEDSMAGKHTVNVAPQLAEPGAPDSEATLHWFSFDALGRLRRRPRRQQSRCRRVDRLRLHARRRPAGDGQGMDRDLVGRRGEAEGAIIGLATRPPAPGEVACLKEIHLGMPRCAREWITCRT